MNGNLFAALRHRRIQSVHNDFFQQREFLIGLNGTSRKAGTKRLLHF